VRTRAIETPPTDLEQPSRLGELQAGDRPLITERQLDEVELVVLRRLREHTLGTHRSVFHGPGFDLVGLRTWEPGDRLSAVDWPQSSLTNFSPLVVRDFEQPGTATVMVVADRSASTRCGTDGRPIGETIAWTIGTLGLSAALFQDAFGLITFDQGFTNIGTIAPRLGRGHVLHCLEGYQSGRGLQSMSPHGSTHVGRTIAGAIRRTAVIVVVSDFLFAGVDDVIHDLAHLQARHDLFLVLVEAARAFELPRSSARWLRVHDVETGNTRILSRRAVRRLAAEAAAWQDRVIATARDHDLDLVRVDADPPRAAGAIAEFFAERRLRKQR